MRWMSFTGLMVVGLLAGCQGAKSSNSGDPQDAFRRGAFSEVGELLTIYSQENSKPPTKVEDLKKYQVGWPGGYNEIRSGEIIIVWSALVNASATDKVLAYQKATPESGGLVLMQDGATVRSMTADEFKAAPKAGK